MTIIHLTNSLAGGGGEQMVLQLAKKSNPIIRTIVFSISSINTLEAKFTSNNIEVHFLNVNSLKDSSIISGLKKLNQIIKDLDDVVFHCHQFVGCMLGIFYKLSYSNIPIIFTLHTNKVASFRKRLLLFITKTFRKKDIIFSTNSAKWYLKNSEIIPNGVDFDTLKPKNNRHYNKFNTFSFLFLGRLDKPKNPLYMIEIAKYLIKAKIDNFVIDVVGDGDMRSELIDKITAYNLTKHFNLFGFQNDIKPYLDKAHCLILPSLWEGMPVVIIEAAAVKLPIIATPVGSIPDFLNGSNASITTLEYFPEAMINVIQNYNQAIAKSEYLYKEIRSDFCIESVFNKHLKLYNAISQDVKFKRQNN